MMRDDRCDRNEPMRTTLVIDDDVMEAARAIAEHQNRSIGQVVSDLARRSLRAPEAARSRNGIALLAAKPGVVVTPEIVNALRDEAP
jgi:hypothetical protein